jgi:hypothetical protein
VLWSEHLVLSHLDMLLRFYVPQLSADSSFFAALRARKITDGHREQLIDCVGLFESDHAYTLRLDEHSLDPFTGNADGLPRENTARGYVVCVNTRASLDAGAPAVEDALAAALATGGGAHEFLLLTFLDLKANTSAFRLSLPALVLRGADGVVRDVASARAITDSGEGEGATVSIADGLHASAKPPPTAPLGWSARKFLSSHAISTRASTARVVIERTASDPISLRVSFEPPSEAACAALLSDDAQWRVTLSAALTVGLSATRELSTRTLPPSFDVVGRAGSATHAAPEQARGHANESSASQLASTALRLNLSLMKWRVLPELSIEKLEATRVLLIGAGALGASVSRTLLAWGVHRLTFIDSAKVSLSNPPRQLLFTAADAAKGKDKAVAAADAIIAADPGAHASGTVANVPTPGRSAGARHESLVEEIGVLREAIRASDAVFLLVDTRESRWLPTLLCAAQSADDAELVCISAALDFETAVIVRHGNAEDNLACFFCAGGDTHAIPQDSLRTAAMDGGRCTVVRPAVGLIAGALAAEVLVSLIHQVRSKGQPPKSPLGDIEHNITRVNLRGPEITTGDSTRARDCVACGEGVMRAYAAGGDSYLVAALTDSSVIAAAAADVTCSTSTATCARAHADGLEEGSEWYEV